MCQRFGHTKRFCRSGQDQSYCERCASKGHSDADCTVDRVSYINCLRAKAPGFQHRATDPGCSFFIRQKAIKRAVAMYCLGPREADVFVEMNGVGSIPDLSGRPLPTLADFLPLHMGAGRAFGPPETSSSELGSRFLGENGLG